MKITQIFSVVTITLILRQCEAAATTYQTRNVNREQRNTIECTMDLTANPCDDFYKYACGNWYHHFDSKYNYTMEMVDYYVNLEMANIFENFSTQNKPKFMKEAYTFYESCKSLKKYEPVKFIKWLEDNDNFNWAASWLHPKNNTQLNWAQKLAKMRTYGLNHIFIQQNFIFNAGKYVIDLDVPPFDTLTKEFFVNLLESVSGQIPSKKVDHLWQEIEEFITQLESLNTIKDVKEKSELDYEKKHIFFAKNLQSDWLKDYLKVILNQSQLNDDMEIHVTNVPYMKALDKLLSEYSQQFLSEYLEAYFLYYLSSHQNSEICLKTTRHLMPFAIYWQYEQLHPELQDEYDSIYEIFTNIRKHFNNTLSDNKHGFNATVIEYLQNKVNNMKLRVNNIPRIDTVATLEKFYQPLNLHTDKVYENCLKLLNFNFLAFRNLLTSRTPALDHTYLENFENSHSSTPFFLESCNTVFVPLTILRYPIYSHDLDNVYKYSTLGFLLAHEMFHGFAGEPISIDSNGRMTFIQFEENPSYNASFNCLLELNPKAIEEKICDTSGIRHAYQAFFDSHPDASSRTVSLHGSETSMRKMFFLNFAQFFCGNLDYHEFDEDVHGPDRDRVADALSHFPEFAKEFNCSRNHRYYPRETCRLWR